MTDAQDEDIVDLVAQPRELRISTNGRPGKWVPDFLIVRRAGPCELVEVKPLTTLHPERPDEDVKIRAWVAACKEAAQREGYQHRLVTEQEIRIDPLFYNAKLIHRHNHPFGDKRLIVAGVIALGRLGPTPTVAELGAALARPDAALGVAIRLDRLGHIRLDRRVRFNKNTCFQVLSNSPGAAQ